jgi:hypothetical protein
MLQRVREDDGQNIRCFMQMYVIRTQQNMCRSVTHGVSFKELQHNSVLRILDKTVEAKLSWTDSVTETSNSRIHLIRYGKKFLAELISRRVQQSCQL